MIVAARKYDIIPGSKYVEKSRKNKRKTTKKTAAG